LLSVKNQDRKKQGRNSSGLKDRVIQIINKCLASKLLGQVNNNFYLAVA
jgi:hypothetical protein